MEYTISSFVDKLLETKGVTGLSAEVMEQLKSDLVERAENIINAEILANMPKDNLEEFEKLIDADDDEALQSFTKEKIPNIDEVVAGGLVKLQNIYLANASE